MPSPTSPNIRQAASLDDQREESVLTRGFAQMGFGARTAIQEGLGKTDCDVGQSIKSMSVFPNPLSLRAVGARFGSSSAPLRSRPRDPPWPQNPLLLAANVGRHGPRKVARAGQNEEYFWGEKDQELDPTNYFLQSRPRGKNGMPGRIICNQ